MPGFVVHLKATVTCSHAGQATPTEVVPEVLVGNQPVAVFGAPYTIAGCTLPPPTVANGPCVTAMFTTAATRVFAFDAPVLLVDSKATCAPSGTPLLIMATQTRVTAI